MWLLFNCSAFAPFIIAGFVLILLLFVEIISFVFGGLSGILDNFVPDSLLEADLDIDTDIDFNADLSWGLKALNWLYVGRIPTMILIILFVGSFSVSGLILQQLSYSLLGHFISPWIASLDALVISTPLVKVYASLLYPILPKEETTAVSGVSLVGQTARIVIGYASSGQPAQAKTIDPHGQIHYIMVEPDPKYFTQPVVKPSIQSSINHSIKPTSTVADQFSKNIITNEDKLVITSKVGGHYLVKKL